MSVFKATFYVLFTLYLGMQHMPLAVLLVFIWIVMIFRRLDGGFSEEFTVETGPDIRAKVEDQDDAFYLARPLLCSVADQDHSQDGGYYD